MHGRLLTTLLLAALLVVALPSCGPSTPVAASYVGAASCASCHGDQHAAWTDSHHDLAMQHATPETVLGRFGPDQSFEYSGVVSEFRREGDAFVVRTDGPDGAMRDYTVEFTFGVEPLQQYLVRFPGGRLQALPFAWDTRPESAGGQRWYHVSPDQVTGHEDPLHWSGPNYNWNDMCASCHSTGLRKGYDAATDAFATTWAELDVSCEACHGPGSDHVAWAQAGADAAADPTGSGRFAADLAKGTTWAFVDGGPIAVRQGEMPSPAQVETCAWCHSRRSELTAGFVHGERLHDHARVADLAPPNYFEDGQIRDEVYVYGSWVQSKMHHAGVVCTDCHDPHSLQLRAEGNALCAQCHSAAVYDGPQHHHHERESAGAQCVACHMPERTYMGVDARRDHSMRVPRPDLSRETDAPHACADCHADRSAGWAAQALRDWSATQSGGDPTRRAHWARQIDAAFEGGRRGAVAALSAARNAAWPGIVRATALGALTQVADPAVWRVAEQSMADADPLVRAAAIEALGSAPVERRLATVTPSLDDPVRLVRLAAARVLAPAHARLAESEAAGSFEAALAELFAEADFNADRAWAWVNRGDVEVALGRLEAAERSYRSALAREAWSVRAAVNLVDVLKQSERDADGRAVLVAALERSPTDPALHYALGMLEARMKRYAEAVTSLAAAARLGGAPRYSYAHALAVDSTGDRARTVQLLEAAAKRWPGDQEILQALYDFARAAGDRDAMQRWRAALQEVR